MSLNDDNRPSTRHHSEMTQMGCRSSEGGISDRSVNVDYLWLVEESFSEKDLRILNV